MAPARSSSTVVEKRRRMAGTGKSTGTVTSKMERDAGGEAALEPAEQMTVEVGKNGGGAGGGVGYGADGAHDERNGHGCAQAFAADIAEDNERGLIFERNDLEKSRRRLRVPACKRW